MRPFTIFFAPRSSVFQVKNLTQALPRCWALEEAVLPICPWVGWLIYVEGLSSFLNPMSSSHFHQWGVSTGDLDEGH